MYILHRMRYFRNDAFAFRYNPLKLMGFWLWIGKEIVVSSLAVTKVIFQRTIEVNPQLIELDVTGFDSLDQAVYGNSITLTPGTLALDVHDDRILVHSMLPQAAADLEAGEMQRRVARLRKR
jgi:multicomponent Na+:H+ antiporter subunit E